VFKVIRLKGITYTVNAPHMKELRSTYRILDTISEQERQLGGTRSVWDYNIKTRSSGKN
jgi:hypothetical protein